MFLRKITNLQFFNLQTAYTNSMFVNSIHCCDSRQPA